MAADFGVYFASDNLPSIDQWEQAANELGLKLRIDPVNLKTHSGYLPVAFQADDYNGGFEFQIRGDWGRSEASTKILRGKDEFAWFRCFRQEWKIASWAALSFARACDGIFQNPLGVDFSTIEEAQRYVEREAPL